jgi:hypothetical protein
MTDSIKYERLDESIESTLRRGGPVPAGDEEVDALARLASGLRGLPDPDFRARLRGELLPAAGPTAAGPVASWIHSQWVFLLGGSSFGLVAGACCLIGATAAVLGIASAAAITDFIDSTLPYFVAISIVSMVAWLVWLLRDRFSLPAIGETVMRHGVALGGAYAAVFGASMGLTMAMGLQ